MKLHGYHIVAHAQTETHCTIHFCAAEIKKDIAI